jgi:hypothetical protein
MSAGALRFVTGMTLPIRVPSARRLRFKAYILVMGSGYAPRGDRVVKLRFCGTVSNRWTYARNILDAGDRSAPWGETKRKMNRICTTECPVGEMMQFQWSFGYIQRERDLPDRPHRGHCFSASIFANATSYLPSGQSFVGGCAFNLSGGRTMCGR